jgi:hypothetical protein
MDGDRGTTVAHDSLAVSSSTLLITALARSVKSVVAAAARIVGPHDPMLGPLPLKATDVLAAKNIIDHIFQASPNFRTSFSLNIPLKRGCRKTL